MWQGKNFFSVSTSLLCYSFCCCLAHLVGSADDDIFSRPFPLDSRSSFSSMDRSHCWDISVFTLIWWDASSLSFGSFSLLAHVGFWIFMDGVMVMSYRPALFLSLFRLFFLGCCYVSTQPSRFSFCFVAPLSLRKSPFDAQASLKVKVGS